MDRRGVIRLLHRLKSLLRPGNPENKPVNRGPVSNHSKKKVEWIDEPFVRTLRQLEKELPDSKVLLQMIRICETTAERAFLFNYTQQGQLWASRLLSLAHLWNACYGQLLPDEQPNTEQINRATAKYKNLLREYKSLLNYKRLDQDGLPSNSVVISDNAIQLVTLGVSNKQGLLNLIRKQPGVTREQLYDALPDAPAEVQGKLRMLDKMNLVKREKTGRVIRFYAL